MPLHGIESWSTLEAYRRGLTRSRYVSSNSFKHKISWILTSRVAILAVIFASEFRGGKVYKFFTRLRLLEAIENSRMWKPLDSWGRPQIYTYSVFTCRLGGTHYGIHYGMPPHRRLHTEKSRDLGKLDPSSVV